MPLINIPGFTCAINTDNILYFEICENTYDIILNIHSSSTIKEIRLCATSDKKRQKIFDEIMEKISETDNLKQKITELEATLEELKYAPPSEFQKAQEHFETLAAKEKE